MTASVGVAIGFKDTLDPVLTYAYDLVVGSDIQPVLDESFEIRSAIGDITP